MEIRDSRSNDRSLRWRWLCVVLPGEEHHHHHHGLVNTESFERRSTISGGGGLGGTLSPAGRRRSGAAMGHGESAGPRQASWGFMGQTWGVRPRGSWQSWVGKSRGQQTRTTGGKEGVGDETIWAHGSWLVRQMVPDGVCLGLRRTWPLLVHGGRFQVRG
jgi:hypothetical protein